MMGWLKSPSGSTTTAVVVAVILALFWFVPWSKPLPFLSALFGAGDSGTPVAAMSAPQPIFPQSSAKATGPAATATSPAPSAPAQTAALDPAPARQPVAAAAPPPAVPLPSAAAPATPTPLAAAPMLPDFDVVRVEPTGSSVIAGRGEPGSEVALLDGGKVIAHVTVDASGQFALLPPDLAEGSHYLTLQSKSAGAATPPATSLRGVAVSVAGNGASRPMVAMLSPDKPVQVLSDGSPAMLGVPSGGPVSATSVNATPLPVSIQAVEAEVGGKFTASGVAGAGRQCRVYLNGSFLADVTADKEGRWTVKVEKGMQPGKYVVRADELDSSSGKVLHRAEVPFDYPVAVAEGTTRQLLPSRTAPVLLSRNPPSAANGPKLASATPLTETDAAGTSGSAAVTASAPTAASPSGLGGAGAGASATTGASGSGANASSVPSTASNSTTPTPTPAAAPAVADPSREVLASAAVGTPAGVGATIVADLQTAKVTRGDSLWRISRKMLGHGIAYTQIYASNTNQIRDPSLIYPGQILVVPSRPN